MLSAFPAVYEVLADAYRPSTSGSEVEETITSREAYCPPVCIMVGTLVLWPLNQVRHQALHPVSRHKDWSTGLPSLGVA